MQRKLVVTGLGAFGLGVLAGWAVTTDLQENRRKREQADYDYMNADKSEHIFALKNRLAYVEMLLSRYEEDTVVENQSEVNENPTTIKVVEPEEDDNTEDETPEDETPEETKTNLQRIIDSYVTNPDDSSEFNKIMFNDEEQRKRPPEVISRATYAWDEEGESYSKITLTYFSDDRVVLDDDEDPIDDVGRMIGWRNLTQFGGESEDPNVVFVRNHKMQTDFEIVKEEDTQLPLHIKYGMEKEEFRANRAAGLIKLRQEDE